MASHIADALHDQIEKLSPRQTQIATLLCEGKNARQIATILSIKPATVKTHIIVACRKLGVDNRVQLIVMFSKWQMLMELDRRE